MLAIGANEKLKLIKNFSVNVSESHKIYCSTTKRLNKRTATTLPTTTANYETNDAVQTNRHEHDGELVCTYVNGVGDSAVNYNVDHMGLLFLKPKTDQNLSKVNKQQRK